MSTISTTIRINDAFSNPLDKLSSGLSRAQSSMNKLKNAFNGNNSFGEAQKSSSGLFKSMLGANLVGNAVSKGMAIAGQGVHAMIGELNEASISWQTFEGNMRQIGKSPVQIAAAKKDMQKFAQQTIYSASDMATTYSQLAAVGVKNTGRLVKGFGGLAASAANPAQAMKTISEQATQMAAKPKVQWMDFKLMLEQAPAGMSAVAKSMGMSLTQLIQKIQDGKVKTSDFLDAVAKTGTNANFSKMATQYKTIGQAMDGLKETLANGLQPQFQKLSQIGINAISGLTDELANLNWDALGNGLVNAIKYVQSTFQSLKQGLSDFTSGFASSGVGSSMLTMFHSIADAIKDVTNTMNKGNSNGSFFTQLGKISGGALSTVAKTISGIANALGKLNPGQLQALAYAFIMLKGGIKGLILTEAVKGLAKLNSLNPGTIQSIAKAITTLAIAFTVLKAVGKGMEFLKGVYDAFSSLGSMKTPKVAAPEVPKTGGILQSAGAFMKLGAALLMVGGAIALVGAGFYLLANAASTLANGGGAVIAIFVGMIAIIVALGVAVAMAGTSMMAGAVGFLIFGAALFLIGAAVFLAAAGVALLASQLANIANYGLQASINLLALGVAIAVFGALAIVAAIGIIVLGVALVVLAVGAAVAAVGLMLFAVSLMLVAVFGMVAVVGLLLLGVSLVLIAAMSMVAAVGLILMGVALMMIMVSAMIAAVGLMLLAVALVLIAPMSMIAGVGLMLLGVGAMVAGAGLMLVGSAAMVAAAGIIMLGASAMIMVSLFIAAFSAMVSAATSGMARVRGAISSGISSAVSAVRGFVGAMASAGAALMQGLVNGIKSMIGSAVAAAQSAASRVAGAIKGFLHIGSPSRLMRQYGRWTVQGFINGINRDSGAAAASALALAQGITDNIDNVNSAVDIGLGTNPGDMLAAGFNRALTSIGNVAGAITNLDGSRANIGVNGYGTLGSSLSSDSVGSSSITPSSLFTSNSGNNTDNSSQITIQKGAISIQSSGNEGVDADMLLEKLEDKIMEQKNKALG